MGHTWQHYNKYTNGLWMTKRIHVQIHTRVWNYNDMDHRGDAGDDVDYCCRLKDPSCAETGALVLIPLVAPFRRWVFWDYCASCGFFMRLTSNPIIHDEIIWRGGPMWVWSGYVVLSTPTVPIISKSPVNLIFLLLGWILCVWIIIGKKFVASNQHVCVKKRTLYLIWISTSLFFW
jgi:hypothetical protein